MHKRDAAQAPSSGHSLRVLVIDDEKNIRSTLAVCLEGMGCRVTGVGDGDAALALLSRHPQDLAFLDLRLAKENGLDLIPKLQRAAPDLAIVVITAYATFESAVEAIRRGARDYVPKPFTPEQIRHVVEKVMDVRALRSRVSRLEAELRSAAPESDLESGSPAMQVAVETVRRAAASDVSVLFRGESGTGKGVLARALHSQSPRKHGPFVVVNCPTLSESLLASELFGHAKGAFTGAVKDQPGRVEAAEGGTLFLDEIAELPPPLQAKLLRFLQEKEFERLGENTTRRADVRVVAATNRRLEEEVAAGRFREDLLYRLNVVEVVVPPLRERRQDLLRLARSFLAFYAKAARRPTQELSPEAEALILGYHWPGNVRELRNAIERITILWPADAVLADAFPERVAGAKKRGPELGGDHTLEAIEREHIERVLERTATAEQAAQILGVDPSTLWRKRKKFEEG